MFRTNVFNCFLRFFLPAHAFALVSSACLLDPLNFFHLRTNEGQCEEYISKVNAEYELCDEEPPYDGSECEVFRDTDTDCSAAFQCLGDGYTCEEDGTVSMDVSECVSMQCAGFIKKGQQTANETGCVSFYEEAVTVYAACGQESALTESECHYSAVVWSEEDCAEAFACHADGYSCGADGRVCRDVSDCSEMACHALAESLYDGRIDSGETNNDHLTVCLDFLEHVNEIYGECGGEAVPDTFDDGYCHSCKDVAGDCTAHFECLMDGYRCEDNGTVSVDVDDCPACGE